MMTDQTAAPCFCYRGVIQNGDYFSDEHKQYLCCSSKFSWFIFSHLRFSLFYTDIFYFLNCIFERNLCHFYNAFTDLISWFGESNVEFSVILFIWFVMVRVMSDPKMVKTRCGIEKYHQLRENRSFWGKLRLMWFLMIATLRDLNK